MVGLKLVSDVWMFAGMVFVFGSLIELAVVGWLTRNDQLERPAVPFESPIRYRSIQRRCKDTVRNRWRCSTGRSNSFEDVLTQDPRIKYRSWHGNTPHSEMKVSWHCTGSKCPRWTPDLIDKMSAILFPVMFVLFNCYYWIYYLLVVN